MSTITTSIFQTLFSKIIDPIVTLLLRVTCGVFILLLIFSIYTIIKLRINPFKRLTPSKVNRLRRMTIAFQPLDFLRWLYIDLIWRNHNSMRFTPFGLTIFCGRQGAGKTISMVDYARTLFRRYKELIIVCNFSLKLGKYESYDYDQLIDDSLNGSETLDQINEMKKQTLQNLLDGRKAAGSRLILRMRDWRDLLEIRNGTRGVLFMIDEIHSEYSSQSWKDFPETLLSEISQQRKQCVKIIASSQVYTRVVKPLREQAFTVVQCRTLLKRWTFTKEYDARDYEVYCENPDPKKKLKPLVKRSFVQSDEIRKCYNTYEKIKRMKKIAESGKGFIPRNERVQ